MSTGLLARSNRWLNGPVGEWVTTIALSCFLLWVIVSAAEEWSERFQGIALILNLVAISTLRPRQRRAKEAADPHSASPLPTWHRVMTPIVLAAALALLVTVTILNFGWAALYAATTVGGMCVTLMAYPSKPRSPLSDWSRRLLLVLATADLAALFALLLGGLWISAVYAALALALLVTPVAIDVRRRDSKDGQEASASSSGRLDSY